jgi:hypothetical protein
MRSRRTRYQVIAVIALAGGLAMTVTCASKTKIITELLLAGLFALASLRVRDSP